jgi:hypothetical protein
MALMEIPDSRSGCQERSDRRSAEAVALRWVWIFAENLNDGDDESEPSGKRDLT